MRRSPCCARTPQQILLLVRVGPFAARRATVASAAPFKQQLGLKQQAVQRVDLGCPEVERGCQGCSVHTNLNTPPVLAQAQAVFAAYAIGLTSTFLAAHGWRTRARLAVRGRAGSKRIRIGLFKPGTHDVFHLPACPLHHARINEVVQLVHGKLQACGVPPYVEVPAVKHSKRKPSGPQSHGLLRYLQLTLCVNTERGEDARGLVQVVCVVNCCSADKRSTNILRNALAELYEARGPASDSPLLHSVWLNFQQAASNTILGGEFSLLHGGEWAWQRYNNTHVALSPASFVQANSGAMAAALRRICGVVPHGAHVLDLHAGIGTIGLCILNERPIASLTCVEINGSGRVAFELSRQQLGAEKRAIPSVYNVCAAGSVPQSVLAAADVIVVDPPRKGLESALVQSLCRLGPAAEHMHALQSPIDAWHAEGEPEQQPRAACSQEDLAAGGCLDARVSSSGQRDVQREQTLVYLSCGFAALQRDLDMLHRQGPWRICSAHAFVFFPGTDSLETLVVLRRQRSR